MSRLAGSAGIGLLSAFAGTACGASWRLEIDGVAGSPMSAVVANAETAGSGWSIDCAASWLMSNAASRRPGFAGIVGAGDGDCRCGNGAFVPAGGGVAAGMAEAAVEGTKTVALGAAMFGMAIAARSAVGCWTFGVPGLAVCTGVPCAWRPAPAGMPGSAGRDAVLAGSSGTAGMTGAVGPFT